MQNRAFSLEALQKDIDHSLEFKFNVKLILLPSCHILDRDVLTGGNPHTNVREGIRNLERHTKSGKPFVK